MQTSCDFHCRSSVAVGWCARVRQDCSGVRCVFREWTRNGDGVITRSEWRGNDNVVSTIRIGTATASCPATKFVREPRRQTRAGVQDWNQDGRVDNLDNQIAQRFRGYDMNSDSRVGRSEWPGATQIPCCSRASTRIATADLSPKRTRRQRGRPIRLVVPHYRFSNIDATATAAITRNEWNMNSADFTRLDVESGQSHQPVRVRERHASDVERRLPLLNGAIQRVRQQIATAGSRGPNPACAPRRQFDRLDSNRDNRLSRFEFENAAGADAIDAANRSAAWRTGYGPGNAGRSSRGPRGLRERPRLGFGGAARARAARTPDTRTDGHAERLSGGYREAFRIAYRAGFAQAGGNRRGRRLQICRTTGNLQSGNLQSAEL